MQVKVSLPIYNRTKKKKGFKRHGTSFQPSQLPAKPINYYSKHVRKRPTLQVKPSLPVNNQAKEKKVNKYLITSSATSLQDADNVGTAISFEESYQMFIMITCYLCLTYVTIHLHSYEFSFGPLLFMGRWPVSAILDVAWLIAMYVGYESIKVCVNLLGTFVIHSALVGSCTVWTCFTVQYMSVYVSKASNCTNTSHFMKQIF